MQSFVVLASNEEEVKSFSDFYVLVNLKHLRVTGPTLASVGDFRVGFSRIANTWSVKIPSGVIEDVLVQVDKFYYPVDFVVLDTDPT
ncbi:hypothetical protein AAG906_028132 [Vitis piasezkii]